MLILVVAKNENVVQIHQNKVINVPMHNGVHKTLEGTWCIAEPKRQKPYIQITHIVLQKQFLHMHPVQVEPGGNSWPGRLHSDTLPLTTCREGHLSSV